MLFAVVGILGASLATLRGVAPVVASGLLYRQLIWSAAGLAVMWLVSRLRLDVLERLAPFAYAAGVVALIAVLIAGEVRGGTRGWFALGPLTFQPSEFGRLGTILMAAAWLGSPRLTDNLEFAV